MRQQSGKRSALLGPEQCLPGRTIAQLCLPLIHQERTIGVLYLEIRGRAGRLHAKMRLGDVDAGLAGGRLL